MQGKLGWREPPSAPHRVCAPSPSSIGAGGWCSGCAQHRLSPAGSCAEGLKPPTPPTWTSGSRSLILSSRQSWGLAPSDLGPLHPPVSLRDQGAAEARAASPSHPPALPGQLPERLVTLEMVKAPQDKALSNISKALPCTEGWTCHLQVSLLTIAMPPSPKHSPSSAEDCRSVTLG